jgi:hypothetical protein
MNTAGQSGPKTFLMELDPLCCDVIVLCFEQFSGEKGQRRSGARLLGPQTFSLRGLTCQVVRGPRGQSFFRDSFFRDSSLVRHGLNQSLLSIQASSFPSLTAWANAS